MTVTVTEAHVEKAKDIVFDIVCDYQRDIFDSLLPSRVDWQKHIDHVAQTLAGLGTTLTVEVDTAKVKELVAAEIEELEGLHQATIDALQAERDRESKKVGELEAELAAAKDKLSESATQLAEALAQIEALTAPAPAAAAKDAPKA